MFCTYRISTDMLSCGPSARAEPLVKIVVVRHLGLVGCFRTSRKEYLVVFYIMQDLVVIAAVALVVWKFEYFAQLT